METELLSYIRNKKKSPIGMVVAQKDSNGDVYVGWSLCMKNDKFDKDIGYVKAAMRRYDIRAHKFSPQTHAGVKNGQKNVEIFVPFSAYNTVTNMVKRAKKYFKVEGQ